MLIRKCFRPLLLATVLVSPWTVNAFNPTPLMRAAARGIVRDVEKLLAYGANINEKDYYGHTALMVSARFCHPTVVKLLLGKGANVDEKNNNGRTALMQVMLASRLTAEGRLRAAEVLLENGANVHEKDNNGDTALMMAIASDGLKDVDDRLRAAELLLKNGANVHEKNDSGDTALMMIISSNKLTEDDKLRTAEVLLKNGANVHEKNDSGWTALMKADITCPHKVVKLLLKASRAAPMKKDGLGVRPTPQ